MNKWNIYVYVFRSQRDVFFLSFIICISNARTRLICLPIRLLTFNPESAPATASEVEGKNNRLSIKQKNVFPEHSTVTPWRLSSLIKQLAVITRSFFSSLLQLPSSTYRNHRDKRKNIFVTRGVMCTDYEKQTTRRTPTGWKLYGIFFASLTVL